ncbi:MAG: cytochrome [Bacteroidota bacterium]|nr:cytochrome [Bacteroidota bacterium]
MEAKRSKLNLKKIVIVLVILFIVIQAFRIDKTNPILDPSKDFMSLSSPPSNVANILNSSCYDCHSNATTYPWYTNISPVSWWIKHHIDEGREELNFSVWGDYSSRKKDHKLKEAVELVESNEMPMESYLWVHGNAKLDETQKQLLISFFNSLRTHESDKPRGK